MQNAYLLESSCDPSQSAVPPYFLFLWTSIWTKANDNNTTNSNHVVTEMQPTPPWNFDGGSRGFRMFTPPLDFDGGFRGFRTFTP